MAVVDVDTIAIAV